MSIFENELFRRLRNHAQKRLVFDPGFPRSKQLPAYKRYVELESRRLKRYHRRGESGVWVCKARAAMIDVVIENLFLAALDLFATHHSAIPGKASIIATGGYGRAELNPHSDIDIMFLYPQRSGGTEFDAFRETITEEVLYPLWDIGFKIGHATRTGKEAIAQARKDAHAKNAILESRFVCGSETLFHEFWDAFRDFYRKENAEDYIRERLTDERNRHAKHGDTVYLQEPDIKSGVGGLRDYQNILWMANIKFGYDSFRDLEKALFLRREERRSMDASYDFLLRARNELHFQNKRPTDTLNLEIQPEVAEQLGYPAEDIFQRVEAFMKDYYSAARTIHRTASLLRERLALASPDSSAPVSFREAFRARRRQARKRVDGFALVEGVFTAENNNVFREAPERLIRVFRHCQQFGANLDPDLRYLLTRSIPLLGRRIVESPTAAKSFLAILRTPGEVYPILNQMHELGVLGRYLPEFNQLNCLVQHEYYHRYTADTHVLNTIRELDNVFQKTDGTAERYERELRKTEDPTLLYVMLMLHDIGKAEGVRGHAESGARIAEPVLRRWGVGAEKREQILFIIRSHLEMARIWQRYDLEDPQTAQSFADTVGDAEKLRYLYVHTFCDACGTAPTLWNGYKDGMHRHLFLRTLEQLGDREALGSTQRERRMTLYEELARRSPEGIEQEELEAHFHLLPERYFVNNSADEIERHLRMVHDLLHQIQTAESVGALRPVIDWRDDIAQGLTVVDVVTWDRAGLFYKLAGALSVAGVNILSTKAISRADHITLDTFYIMDPDGGVVSRPHARERFTQRLEEQLVHSKDLLPEILEEERKEARAKKKTKEDRMLPAPFPPSIEIYHELSLQRTIVEAQANDRIALLYRIARQISENGFDITFARIATEHGVAMDTFYIEPGQEAEAMDPANLLELRDKLEAIVREPLEA